MITAALAIERSEHRSNRRPRVSTRALLHTMASECYAPSELARSTNQFPFVGFTDGIATGNSLDEVASAVIRNSTSVSYILPLRSQTSSYIIMSNSCVFILLLCLHNIYYRFFVVVVVVVFVCCLFVCFVFYFGCRSYMYIACMHIICRVGCKQARLQAD